MNDVVDAEELGSEEDSVDVESCDKGEGRGGMAMCMSVRCILVLHCVCVDRVCI